MKKTYFSKKKMCTFSDKIFVNKYIFITTRQKNAWYCEYPSTSDCANNINIGKS